ncbi:hypothetical protein ANCCAN_04032 [Ancylostoma caninum]|uniref:Uncharacterized protein n=1 Tax=Ancylostoma caninum TaxID=29170 RepID=A0A368H3E8_ANCCA|nr:hypothetical protein ANCCAN_04032 [Ancylostoma caninum]
MSFYLNWPWIIDEHDYNCSSRTVAEWLSRGTVNEIQGMYFAITGAIFLTVYVLCLIAMYRGPLIKIPCYQLMFYNGIVDVLDLIRGSVFCSDPVIEQIAGHLVWRNVVLHFNFPSDTQHNNCGYSRNVLHCPLYIRGDQ